ncbi:MAG: hypothetical protein ACOYJA_10340 [Christensenellales bacterium]
MTNPNGSGEERALRADGLPVFEGEPETGYIQLFASVGGGSRPVEGVTGLITRNIPGSEDPVLLYSLVTDRSGKTQVVPVPAPPASLSTNPDNAHPYATYDVHFLKPGYNVLRVQDAQVFAGITSLITVEMIPASDPSVPQPTIITTVVPPDSLTGSQGGTP